MDDNDKQMTLPGMEDSDELTNPLTSSTKDSSPSCCRTPRS